MSAVCPHSIDNVWFFSITKIWAVIFCCAVLLVPFLGKRRVRGDIFISLYDHVCWMERATECRNGKFVERE
jgi:hypothetical protein